MTERALIMAGGGLKVAFQAGVLQVWLDELRDPAGERVEFAMGDGASGGVFNLAMWAQGMSGTQIADHWRAMRPLAGVSPNLRPDRSLLTYDRFRRNVLQTAWSLDWERIRATDRTATFNLFNFTRQEHRVLPASAMDEDHLVSAVSLPVWFPPVRIGGDQYIDAVFATDANLDAAIAAGADEVWVIWTVSRRGVWRNGLVNQYFQMIEAIANSHVEAGIARIERSNRALDTGLAAEYDRPIRVRQLTAEVPAHYLFDFTNAVMREAVERGVTAARSWAADEGFTVEADTGRAPAQTTRGVSFAETMRGSFAFGEDAYATPQNGIALDLRLTFADLDRFLVDPQHAGTVTGWVESDALGGKSKIDAGTIELMADDGDFTRKQMRYRICFRTGDGDDITLFGTKYVVHERHLDLWPDTTTLHSRLYRGAHAQRPGDDRSLIGTGVVRISALGFARELISFRTTPGPGGRAAALGRFGAFFGRQLWEVYGRPVAPGESDET